MNRLDLTRFRIGRKLLVGRWPQFILRVVALAGYLFTILTGLIGSKVGSHNFAIIFVWIAWWTVLKLVLIPLGGRSWCSNCPIPLPGEWLQNRSLTRGRPAQAKGLRWPRQLRGSWLQAGGFLLIGLFGAVTLTTPLVTGLVLLSVLVLAFALSLVFERRAFCQHLCPIGGFSGLYAQAAPVEVRVKDQAICKVHKEKDCLQACPWGLYTPSLKSNEKCGLCLECVRACPLSNIAVNLRRPGSDLGPGTTHRLDSPFLGLVMLTSALINAAVFLGPWGQIKMAAYAVGSPAWLVFAGICLAGVAAMAGLYGAAVWLTQRLRRNARPLREALGTYGQLLVPLGLSSWIAFTISFAFAKFSYVLPVLLDPFGWGWKIAGAIAPAQVGQVTAFSLMLQVSILAGGLFWTSRLARQITGSVKQAIPLAAFAGLFSLGMLRLLVG